VIDPDSSMEVHADYARNMVIGFARVAGRTVGCVANQPAVLAGVLDIDASVKARALRPFLRCLQHPAGGLCGRTPASLPGTDQEWRGIIGHGAKLLYAFSEATVPRITIITRKAYGGAYDVMNSKHIGCDMNFAWPSAEIAVMGAKGAAEIIFKGEIAKAKDPQAKWKEKEMEYQQLFANPYEAAARGYVDEVIRPQRNADQGDACIGDAAQQGRPASAQEAREHSPVRDHGEHRDRSCGDPRGRAGVEGRYAQGPPTLGPLLCLPAHR
jgi:propionyl-CoA carboxylase beta chain